MSVVSDIIIIIATYLLITVFFVLCDGFFSELLDETLLTYLGLPLVPLNQRSSIQVDSLCPNQSETNENNS